MEIPKGRQHCGSDSEKCELKTFVQMLEALGYDIEITYVKRND